MVESGYFPTGAEYSLSAPYNQKEIPDMDFHLTCSQCLSKTVKVTTNDYLPGATETEYEKEHDGSYSSITYTEAPDTFDTSWSNVYHENDYHTPAQLLTLFKQFLEENKEHGIVFKSPGFTDKLIEECSGWTEDNTEYIKE